MTAAAILVSLFCVVELVGFPGWTRHNTFDWAFQSCYAAVALAALVTAVAVLVRRPRSATSASSTA